MNLHRETGIYEKYIKRILDITCSLVTIILFSWLYAIIAIVVRINMGSPVLFKQIRPGKIQNGTETLFSMYKFRTMTDAKDENGRLLPDERRLTSFGKMLRATSLDELPEVLNILRGDMSIIGPRPQLVRDLVFMDDKIRMRHTASPGLSGLAQVNGRNALTWEKKFEWDLKYIEKISFWNDCRIVGMTVRKALFGREGITEEGQATATDYGDYLLNQGLITQDVYDEKQRLAEKMLREYLE